MKSTRSPLDSTASAHEKTSMRVCMIRTIWRTVSRKRGNRQRINQIYCGLRIKGMHAAEGAILPNANGSRMRRAAKSPQTRGEGKQHEIQTTRRIIKKNFHTQNQHADPRVQPQMHAPRAPTHTHGNSTSGRGNVTPEFAQGVGDPCV